MSLTIDDLDAQMKVRIDRLNLCHPYPQSKRFKEISYEKWACKEVLREIEFSEHLPFIASARDILESMKKRFESAPGHITCFNIGADLIDELISIDEGEKKHEKD